MQKCLLLTLELDIFENVIKNQFYFLSQCRSQDIGGALRHVAKMQDHSVMVDLLGAIIEKP